jgi:hypothetical protein
MPSHPTEKPAINPNKQDFSKFLPISKEDQAVTDKAIELFTNRFKGALNPEANVAT